MSPAPAATGRRAPRRPGVLAALVFVAASGCGGGDDGALSVVIALPAQNLGGATRATLSVDYSGAGARVVEVDGSPECAFLLPGIDGSFGDNGQGELTVRLKSGRALRGPLDVAACRLEASDAEATAASLRQRLAVRVASAEDASGKALDLAALSKAGAGGAPDPDAIEAAQAEAVKAAASVAPAAPTPLAMPADAAAAGGSPGALWGRPAGVPGAAGMDAPAGQPANPAPPGATAFGAPGPGAAPGGAGRPQPPPPSRPSAPVPLVRDPTGGGGGTDEGEVPDNGAPTGRDPDPGYDDSASDDPSAPAYTVEIAVTSGGPRLGALQLNVSHLGNGGGFIGRGDQIDCVAMAEAIFAGNYLGERLARLGLISLAGIRTPAPVLRCGFRTREAVSTASFLIEVVDSADQDSNEITPPPTVAVTQVFRR